MPLRFVVFTLSSLLSVITPDNEFSKVLTPPPRVSLCTSNPTTKGPTRFIVALFLIVAPPLALSRVDIREPPTKNFCVFQVLPAIFSVFVSVWFSVLIESIVRFFDNVNVLLPAPPPILV